MEASRWETWLGKNASAGKHKQTQPRMVIPAVYKDVFLRTERRNALMRKLLSLICILGTPCASWAQSSQASWQNLSTLQAGQNIQVVEMNSKKDSGTFLSASATAISLQGAAGEQTIQKQDVRSVKLMENKHRLRNTLVGGAIGAGAGAGIGEATYGCSSGCIGFSKGDAAAVGTVLGLVGGAIIGALLLSHKMIYRV
jgi:hypothetical protein